MRFQIILSSCIESDSRANFSLNGASFLGMQQHFLFFLIEHIQRAGIRWVFHLELTNPKGILFDFNFAVRTNGSFKFFMTNFASLVVKNCSLFDSSFNNWETFGQVFQSWSHLLNSSFWVDLRVWRVKFFRMVFLRIHFSMHNVVSGKDCADQNKGVICEHFHSKTLKADPFSCKVLREFLVPDSDIDKSILSKSLNEGKSQFIPIFLFFFWSSNWNDLESCCDIIVEKLMTSFIYFFKTQWDRFFRFNSFHFFNWSSIFNLNPSISWVEALRKPVMTSFLEFKSSGRNHNFLLNIIFLDDSCSAFFSMMSVFDSCLKLIVSIGDNSFKGFFTRHKQKCI